MRQHNSRPAAIKPRNSADGLLLTGKRERLNLSQAEVAAFLTLRFRKPVNQARITEFEQGLRPVKPEIKDALVLFYQRVEQAQRKGLIWQDLLVM